MRSPKIYVNRNQALLSRRVYSSKRFGNKSWYGREGLASRRPLNQVLRFALSFPFAKTERPDIGVPWHFPRSSASSLLHSRLFPLNNLIDNNRNYGAKRNVRKEGSGRRRDEGKKGERMEDLRFFKRNLIVLTSALWNLCSWKQKKKPMLVSRNVAECRTTFLSFVFFLFFFDRSLLSFLSLRFRVQDRYTLIG